MPTLSTAEERVLTSEAFRRARATAQRVVTAPGVLRRLLEDVDRKCDTFPVLADPSASLHLDIVCAVVEAAIGDSQGLEQRLDANPASVTGQARLRLAVASLLYLLDDHDLIPDSQPHGLTDDIVLLRWASRTVRAELPAP